LYGNLLSQWRGYGEANIGFDYEGMKSDFCEIEDKSGITVETSGVIFSECEYLSKNDESFNKRADDIENRMKEIIKSNSSLSDQQYNYLSIGVTCFSIKHPGFREESESRIYSYLWNRGPFSHNTTMVSNYTEVRMLQINVFQYDTSNHAGFRFQNHF
jgi:hypothetical protein